MGVHTLESEVFKFYCLNFYPAAHYRMYAK